MAEQKVAAKTTSVRSVPPDRRKVKPARAVKPAAPPAQPAKAPSPPVPSNGLPYSRETTEYIFAAFRPNGENRFKCTITPQMAEQILVANVGNRSVSETTVAFYVRGLKGQEWVENGEAIKFDITGRLLDGQHRLMACVAADIAIVTDVVLGLDPKAQLTMDAGRRRTVGDNLNLSGERHGTSKAAMMRYLFRMVADQKNYRTSTAEVLKLLDRYPQIADSVHAANASPKRGAHSPMLATIHFLACQFMGEKKEADAFLKVFHIGVPYYIDDKNNLADPAHRLRERILSLSASGKKFTPSQLCDNLVQAYNLFSERRSPLTIREPKENVKLKNLDASLVDLS